MKAEIHPDYHKVLFVDVSTGKEWLSRSTMQSKESREVDGEQVPVIRLEVTSYSHPLWTGHTREIDADGNIDRYRRRYGKKK